MLPRRTSNPSSRVQAHSGEAAGSGARGGGEGAWARGARGFHSGHPRSRTPSPCKPEI